MYFTYILQSELDKSYYVGYSKDPTERLKKHNNSNTGYTSKKKPWKLVFTKEFYSKNAALRFEKKIKNMKSKKYIETLIFGN